LANQVAAHREGVKELIIKVVEIGNDDDGGVFQFGTTDKLPRIRRNLAYPKAIRKLLPDPWVCQITPTLRSPFCRVAVMVLCKALWTAWN